MSEREFQMLGIAAASPKVVGRERMPIAVKRLMRPKAGSAGMQPSDLQESGNAFRDHGGRVLAAPRVKPIFWGTAWYRPWLHPGPSAGDVLWAMKSVCSGRSCRG
jgi:hypothetical protein